MTSHDTPFAVRISIVLVRFRGCVALVAGEGAVRDEIVTRRYGVMTGRRGTMTGMRRGACSCVGCVVRICVPKCAPKRRPCAHRYANRPFAYLCSRTRRFGAHLGTQWRGLALHRLFRPSAGWKMRVESNGPDFGCQGLRNPAIIEDGLSLGLWYTQHLCFALGWAHRAVAQFGSAPALGAGCRRFKSCQPDRSPWKH